MNYCPNCGKPMNDSKRLNDAAKKIKEVTLTSDYGQPELLLTYYGMNGGDGGDVSHNLRKVLSFLESKGYIKDTQETREGEQVERETVADWEGVSMRSIDEDERYYEQMYVYEILVGAKIS